MLVLGRREKESIHIGENIIVSLVKIDRNYVRIGIDAPPDIVILREEIMPFCATKKHKKMEVTNAT